MIVNKVTGARTPIIDTGKEFILELLIPKEEGVKTTVKKECLHKIVQGGYWNAIMDPRREDDTSVDCQVCCPATLRRHP